LESLIHSAKHKPVKEYSKFYDVKTRKKEVIVEVLTVVRR
jgi:hypothetical protein